MQKYKLTISFDFEAVDDIEARQMANKKFELLSYTYYPDNINNEPTAKLQTIYDNKPPTKIEL